MTTGDGGPVPEELWRGTNGSEALARHAPEVAEVLRELVATMPEGAAGRLVGPARAACAATLGLRPLGGAVIEDIAPGDGAALGFAEQFSADVSAIDAARRAALTEAVGRDTFAFVQAVYVADMVPRVRAALDALFGPDPAGWPVERPVPGDLWPLVDGLIRAVWRLDKLDPVTTELVRLRGARQHRCRLCQSLRSRSALLAGASDAEFDAVDEFATSHLSTAHKAALALTDGMIWQPAHLPPSVVADVRRWWTPAEAVELVLDVMRNAANKIAVALAADAAHVSDGIEIYDIDPTGDPHYGLTAP